MILNFCYGHEPLGSSSPLSLVSCPLCVSSVCLQAHRLARDVPPDQPPGRWLDDAQPIYPRLPWPTVYKAGVNYHRLLPFDCLFAIRIQTVQLVSRIGRGKIRLCPLTTSGIRSAVTLYLCLKYACVDFWNCSSFCFLYFLVWQHQLAAIYANCWHFFFVTNKILTLKCSLSIAVRCFLFPTWARYVTVLEETEGPIKH